MDKDIAIIGVGLRLPAANNMDMYWNNLIHKRDCIRSIPEQRKKDLEQIRNAKGYPKLTYKKKGYLEDIDLFDYEFFGMSSKEARLMSPYHRMILEVSWEALQDAGYTIDKLDGSNTGVYIGAWERNDYLNFIDNFESQFYTPAIPWNTPSITASRTSYTFNLTGPSMLVDTACSSSLVAIHEACKALENGDCNMAIAGGISLGFYNTKTEWKLGIESSTDRAYVFDQAADGTSEGEGVAVITLKKYKDALQNGDRIYAVIKGTAFNNDGFSKALTVPNEMMQSKVIEKAWNQAHINPEKLIHIEAHGTGTKLGDPIEVRGLKRAFRKYTDKTNFCALSSVKANIGHLNHASGIAGLLKSILILNKNQIPPQINFSTVNKEIGLTDSPFYITTDLKVLPKSDGESYCGVSSFGMDGSNCHVVLGKAVEDNQECENSSNNIMVISGKSRYSLIENMKEYIHFFNETEENFTNICYTATNCREQYKYRVAIVCKNIEECRALLKEYLEKESSVLGKLFYGEIDEDDDYNLVEYRRENLDKLPCEDSLNNLSKKQLQVIAKKYSEGNEIAWSNLYKGMCVKKVGLPFYVYHKKRCWIKLKTTDEEEVASAIHLLESKLNLKENSEYRKQLSIILNKWKNSGVSDGAVAAVDSQKEISTEQKLLAIFKEILEIDDLEVDDNLIDLGADSLLTQSIVLDIQKELEVDINIGDIYIYPTIKELSEYVKKAKKKTYSDIEKIPDRDDYEVSSAQKRLYILDKFESIGTSYNMPFATLIEGKIQQQQLMDILTRLIERHESLRTSFHMNEKKKVVQKIHPMEEISINLQTARITENADIQEKIEEIIHQFVSRFNLAKAPLIHFLWIELNEDKHILVCDVHHIIMDGSSVTIFRNEFFALYNKEELPRVNIRYRDFAYWQNELLMKRVGEQEKYWKHVFSKEKKIPVINLPYDFKRPKYQNFDGTEEHFELSEFKTLAVYNFLHSQSVTLAQFLISVFYVTLYKYSNQEDIIIGVSTTGRRHERVNDIIGMFSNTLPMRSQLSDGLSFENYLASVKKTFIEAVDNQDYQLEYMLENLEINRDISRNPLFDVLFTVWNFDRKIHSSDTLKMANYVFKNTFSKFDLSLFVYEDDGKIKFVLEYCTKLFKKETIQTLRDNYLHILEDVLKKPSTLLGQLIIEVPNKKLKETADDDLHNALTSYEYAKDYEVYLYNEELHLSIVLDEEKYANDFAEDIEKEKENKVEQWSSLYDMLYTNSKDVSNLKTNFATWNDSYTGNEIPEIEMKEWLDSTVRRIQYLKPNSILEIGCGTGMYLFRLQEDCEFYHGIDISKEAVAYVNRVMASNKEKYCNVKLECTDTKSFLDNTNSTYDFVLMNSVVQYFPNADYLVDIIGKLVSHVTDNGIIYLGDIRNYALQEVFQTSIMLSKLTEVEQVEEIKKAVKKVCENELMLSPQFFFILQKLYSSISDVDIFYKKGQYDNELSRFRYDVVLYINRKSEKKITISTTDWKNTTIENLEEYLKSQTPDMLQVKHIPNKRIWSMCKKNKLIKQCQENQSVKQLLIDNKNELNCENFMGLNAFLEISNDYNCEILWDGDSKEEYYTVCYLKKELITKNSRIPFFSVSPSRIEKQELYHYVTNPIKNHVRSLVKEHLENYLLLRVDEEKMPVQIGAVEEIPRFCNGVCDIETLEGILGQSNRYQNKEIQVLEDMSFDNEIEKIVINICTSYFKIQNIDTSKLLYDYGANSIDIISLELQIEEEFNLTIPFEIIYQKPTVKNIAQYILENNI